MKEKLVELGAIFIWVGIVFFWANSIGIPKPTIEYVVKTLPLILLGIWIIKFVIKKWKNK